MDLSHHPLQSCRRHQSHRPWEKSWSQRQSEVWQRQRNSAGTAWRGRSERNAECYSKYVFRAEKGLKIFPLQHHMVFLAMNYWFESSEEATFLKISQTTPYSFHFVLDNLGFLNKMHSVWPQISSRVCLVCSLLCSMSVCTRGESWHK